MKTIKTDLKIVSILAVFLFLAACGGTEAAEEPTLAPAATEAAVAVQTVVVVATPTAEVEVEPTEADLPPIDSSSAETAVVAEAPVLQVDAVAVGEPMMTTLTPLNVRTGPGTHYQVVGSLPSGVTAAIVGKSPNGHWWQIVCPAGTGPQCWASAGSQYSAAENADGVPVAAVPPAPTHAATATQSVANHTPTYTPTATATTDPAVTPSPTLTPDPNSTATATATATEPGAPTASATASATTTTEATATATATATQAVQVAAFDNDSLQNPAVSHFFSPTGTRNFSYTNEVSYENGDQEDWVEFEFPNNSNSNQNVWLTLECTIVGDPEAQLRATIYEDGAGTTKIALCNQGQVQLTVDNTKTQQVRIHFGITKPDIYATYTLTVVGFN